MQEESNSFFGEVSNEGIRTLDKDRKKDSRTRTPWPFSYQDLTEYWLSEVNGSSLVG